MHKVCFDLNDKIIGFDLYNFLYHIDLFYLYDIKKIISTTKKIHAQDSIGRKLYYDVALNKIQYKKNDNCTPYIINENYDKEVYLEYTPNEFNLNDIINIKKNQLMEKFNCNDCLLDEFLIDNVFNFNTTKGKNLMIVNKPVISNKIEINSFSQFAIYYESTNDLKLEISYDGKTFISIEKETFIKKQNNSFYIKIVANKQSNIYSFALLYK